MLSLAMFPIAILGIFDSPPKKSSIKDIKPCWIRKTSYGYYGCWELACGNTWLFLVWHKEATEEHFTWSTCPPQPSETNCIVVGMAGFTRRYQRMRRYTILGPVSNNRPKTIKTSGCHMLMGTRLQACKAPEQHLWGHLERILNRCPTKLPMVSTTYQPFSTKWLRCIYIYININIYIYRYIVILK